MGRRRIGAVGLLLVLLLPLAVRASPAAVPVYAGDRMWAEGNRQAALGMYRAAADAEPWNPVPHLRAGDLLLDLDRPVEASAAFAVAVQSAPERADAWRGWGYALAASDDKRQAAEAFARAAQLQADPWSAWHAGHLYLAIDDRATARSLLALAAEWALRSGDVELETEARILLAMLLAADQPAEAEGELARARRTVSASRLARVERLVDRLEGLSNARGRAHRLAVLGRAALAAGSAHLAASYLREAASLEPAYADAHSHLALAGLAMGDASAAAEAAKDALASRADHPLALYARAAALRAGGDAPAAATELRRLLAEEPGEPAFILELAAAHADHGDYAGALQLAAPLLARSGGDPGVLAAARFLLDRGLEPGAVAEALAPALQSYPDDAALWEAYGWANQLVGRGGEARAALERAVALDPLSASASYRLGVTYRQAGLPSPAAESLTRAAQLDPSGAIGRRARATLAEAIVAQPALPTWRRPLGGW